MPIFINLTIVADFIVKQRTLQNTHCFMCTSFLFQFSSCSVGNMFTTMMRHGNDDVANYFLKKKIYPRHMRVKLQEY